jgi:myo-inositol 2-dehydrogenase/D-chiro-inositol 1-dehydrogenase
VPTLLADERRARVQIGFQRRFDTGYATARAAVAAGSLGWIHTLRGGTADPAPPPAAYIATSGGIFANCSVHDFDAIRWVTGREIVDAYATGSNRGANTFGQAGDALAMVSATRYNGAGYDVRLEVLGSAGSVGIGLDDGLPLTSAEPDVAWPAGPSYTGFVERFHDAYVRELEAFLDVVTGGIQSPHHRRRPGSAVCGAGV